jgi:TolB-like protein/Flp pilus assembly protein TadD
MAAAGVDDRRLDSWKEIASYLGRSVRTVQRWERHEALPVHRLQHDKLGNVYAWTRELDAWWKERSLRLPPEAEPEGPDEPGAAGESAPPARRLGRTAALLAGLVAVVAGAFVALRGRPAGAPPGPPRLAVLPMANLTGQPDREFLSDSLTEELIATLGMLPDLGVIARTSVMRYKGRDTGVAEIGRDLRADLLLEGSVREAGERLRVTIQLIRVADETHLWAETFDRKVGDLLGVQAEVARRVAEEVKVRLPPPRDLYVDPEAYLAYLRGRYHWNRRTREGFEEAVVWFQKALDADPKQARAWAGLADTYVLSSNYGHRPPGEVMPLARDAAARAIALDQRLPEGHASLAAVLRAWVWDFPGAEREFKRALALNPNYALAHLWYGILLSDLGRFDEARATLRRGLESDPLSSVLRANMIYADFFEGRYEAALQELQAEAARRPEDPHLHLEVARVSAALGRVDEASQAAARMLALAGDEPMIQALHGYIESRAGRKEAAQSTFAALRAQAGTKRVAPYYLALLAVGLGENETALDFWEEALEERHVGALSVLKDPEFEPLRPLPRYRELVRRFGLPSS